MVTGVAVGVFVIGQMPSITLELPAAMLRPPDPPAISSTCATYITPELGIGHLEIDPRTLKDRAIVPKPLLDERPWEAFLIGRQWDERPYRLGILERSGDRTSIRAVDPPGDVQPFDLVAGSDGPALRGHAAGDPVQAQRSINDGSSCGPSEIQMDQPLYVLARPVRPDGALAETTILLAVDRHTGAERWRQEIVGVVAGPTLHEISRAASADHHSGSTTTRQAFWPGAALAPDGRAIAIVHADRPAVSVVDLEDRSVRTVPISRRGRFDLPAGGIGVLPVLGKQLELPTVNVSVRYSTDGRRLLVIRAEQARDWAQQVSIALIDATSGHVLAEHPGTTTKALGFSRTGQLANEDVRWSTVSPFDGALYLFTERDNSPDLRFVLRRFDPLTLRVTAERGFSEARSILFSPKVR